MYCEIAKLWHLINKRWTPGGVQHSDANTSSILWEVLCILGPCKSSTHIAQELCWTQVGLNYVLNQILAYIPCWIRTKILCVGTASVIHRQELCQGEWSQSFLVKINKLAKLSRTTNKKKRNKAKIFICPWIMAEYKGGSSEKSFFSSAFSSLGRMSGCPQLHWNRIISLSEMNSPRKQLLIMRLQIGCSPAHPPPRTQDKQLICRTKQVFVLHHRRWLLVSFTTPISCCFLFHAAWPKVNYIIWKRCQSHSYYSTKDVQFSINTSGQIS